MSWWVWLLYFGVFGLIIILITVLLRRSSSGRLVHRHGAPSGTAGFADTTWPKADKPIWPSKEESKEDQTAKPTDDATLPSSNVQVQAEPAGAPSADGTTQSTTAAVTASPAPAPEGTPPSQWAPTPDKEPVPARSAAPGDTAPSDPASADSSSQESADAPRADTARDSTAEVPAVAEEAPAAAATSPSQSGNVIVRGPHGDDSAAPPPDGAIPAGYSIKGDAGSMRYHTKESPSYGATKASVFFRTEGAALFAGFKPWNWRSSPEAPAADLAGQRDGDEIPAGTEQTAVAEPAGTTHSEPAESAAHPLADEPDEPDEPVADETPLPETATPETATPETAPAEHIAPEGTVPEGAVPEGAVPEQALPQQEQAPAPAQPTAQHAPYGEGSAEPLEDGVVPAQPTAPRADVTAQAEGSPQPEAPEPRPASATPRPPVPVVFNDGSGTASEPERAGATLTAARPDTDTGTKPDTSAETDEWPPAPYGKDSAAPRADGSAPEGFTIKGNSDSMLFHTEDSPYYRRTRAEAWFRTEEAAVAAGFKPWNWRKRQD